MVYDAASRRPVLDLKRSGRRDGLATLASWMLQSGRTLVDEADLIVPVPLHYARLVRRGFNQSGWHGKFPACPARPSWSMHSSVRGVHPRRAACRPVPAAAMSQAHLPSQNAPRRGFQAAGYCSSTMC